MFAIIEAKKSGVLNARSWMNNLIAGMIVGVVALPLSMAFAIASGVKPEQGIYTAIIAGFIVSVCGGTRVQIAGPTGAFIVVLSGITAKYGFDGLQIATLMAGAILFLLGLARLGSVIKFIPDPVIIGFTAGIGVIIWVGQWGAFFGLPEVKGEHFHNTLINSLRVLPQLHLSTTLLSTIALLLVIFAPKIPKLSRVPGPLIALVVVTLIQVFFQFDGVETIGSAFGGIPQGLPQFKIPELTWNTIIPLIGPAFTIAMLGAIESLLSAVVADGMAGTRHNSNQELVGQGLANMIVPFFGGFAATGAIARTATNIRNGGTNPLAGIVHSISLILILLILAPFAANIPLAALAAILFVVAWNMSEAKYFIKIIKRAPRGDVVILLITFFLTIFVDLVVAVNIGVILATLYFLRRMTNSVEIRQSTEKEIKKEFTHQIIKELPKNILIYTVEGPFFFGITENFERTLEQTNTDPEHLLIRLKWVPFMDITGLKTLEDVITRLQSRGVNVMISGAIESVSENLRKAGVIDLIGEENNFKTFDDALAFINNHLC